jgi:hypothetical protein
MARSLENIQTELLDAKESVSELNALEVLTMNEVNTLGNVTSTSKVAVWRLWIYVFAFAQWVQEKLWDVFRNEVETRIAETRIHTKEWYRNEALIFQLGYELQWNGRRFVYETIDEIAKIIKHAAVQKYIINGYGVLRVKVAKEVNDERVPLTNEELQAFSAYMNSVGDAGTVVIPTSAIADDLKLEITISYDPLVLNNAGQRLDGTDDTPVLSAIKTFLRSFEFNGELVLQKLQNHLETIEGVAIPHTTDFLGWSKYALHTYDSIGIQNAGKINEIRQADAGYMKLDEANTIIHYIANNE